VAEAVWKNNAPFAFGAVSESHCDGLKNNATPVSKNNERIISRPSQNLVATGCRNDAALVLKENARIVFGAVSTSLVDDSPNKYCC
jgi:hypothetical protein